MKQRLAILLLVAVTLSAVTACRGRGRWRGSDTTTTTTNNNYYCNHCSTKLQWENEETSWKCPSCSGLNIRINCSHCGKGWYLDRWGYSTCSSCGNRFGAAQCGNCGKAKRTDGYNSGSVCQHCGGQ